MRPECPQQRAAAALAAAAAGVMQGLVVCAFLVALAASPGHAQDTQGQGVLLNETEMFDPLVEMNLTVMQPNVPYHCNSTQGPNPALKPINGQWVATCELMPEITSVDVGTTVMTILNVTNMTANAIHSIPSSISNLYTLSQLKMTNVQLTGTLPLTLGYMGFMRDLNLSANFLNGTVPGTLFILTNLTSLDLNSNRLTSSISSSIGNLVSLTHVDLGRNFLSGSILSSLSTLTGLTYLDLSGYPFPPPAASGKVIQPITKAGNLNASLGFSDSVTVVGNSLGNLTALRYLDLSNNPQFVGNLTDLPWLKWHDSLQTFNYANTSILGPIPSLMFNMSQLTSVVATPEQKSALCTQYNDDFYGIGVNLGAPENQTSYLCNYCPGVCYPKPTSSGLPLPVIVGIVIAAAVLVMGGLIGAYYFLRAKHFSDGVEVHGVRRFTLPELEEATDNYSTELGKGGFGEVYKGIVSVDDDKQKEVAVKRTKAERRRNMKKFDSGFRNEILVLSGVRHRNLVELVGYCSKGADVLLVYEFIAQGSVDDLLKAELKDTGEGMGNLTWERRLKIAFGAAQGLDYLHSGVTPPIIHRDIKSSNILVDEDFVSKVADFGLSKIRPEIDLDGQKTAGVQGTLGYIDPEYAATLKPTERSDVYSFGVVLLELATGWRPIGGPEKKHIIQRVAKGVNSSGFDSILAPTIRKELEEGYSGEGNGHREVATTVLYTTDPSDDQASGAEVTIAAYTPELFQRFVKLGMQCCAKDSTTRPSMRTVAKALGEMIEGKAEDPADAIQEERFDEDGGEEVVLLTHNLGGEVGATVAFVMETQVGPR